MSPISRNQYLIQLQAAIEATAFPSASTFAWFGSPSEPLPSRTLRTMTAQALRSYVSSALQAKLYTNFYCVGRAVARTEGRGATFAKAVNSFSLALSGANAGKGYLEPGWQTQGVLGNQLLVSKGGLQLTVPREEGQGVLCDNLDPGEMACLPYPKDLFGMSPGFYMALSDNPFDSEAPDGLVRLYWNLRSEGAVPFVSLATSLLNSDSCRFRLKVVHDPAGFSRCDAGVIYVPKSSYSSALTHVEELYSHICQFLKPMEPAFTKRLAPGLGLAEDPGQGNESFGMSRCRVLASALIHAHETMCCGTEERTNAVLRYFAQSGIELEKPYLNSGSVDSYEFVVPDPKPARAIVQSPVLGKTTLGDFRDTAVEIGERILRDAFWHEGACNWLGAEPTDGQANGRITYKTLGPDLYGGTAGVGVFFSDLFAATRDPKFRGAALACLKQAFNCHESIAPASRPGLYTGWTGISMAAAHIGSVVAEERWIDESMRLAHTLDIAQTDAEPDLLSGLAGCIVGLLAIHRLTGGSTLVDLAQRIAIDLERSAERHGDAYSWKPVAFRTNRNLTGFSHGAAGIGFAFARLFERTGDLTYRRAAERAFQYERIHFSEAARNWPDFRNRSGRRSERAQARFVSFWCHGAPGIALSRLHAYRVFDDDSYRSEALTAMAVTRASIKSEIESQAANFSLCHGLAGNSEVLRYALELLGNGDLLLMRQMAEMGMERYGRHDHSWPCGCGGGDTPNLMLGLAGVGHFYLGMSGASTFPVLMP
jgi:Lanthionine synthetase C-like protein/HopA1 effector protein family